MIESFQRFYDTFIYIPQLNILQLFYNLTGDIGVSIVLLAILVNLIMWPLFSSAYINGQKLRILQPLLTEIREKYKTDPQTLLKEMRLFNQKHGIRNNSLFLVIIVQIIFATALWTLTRNISSGTEVDGVVQLSGIYEEFFGRSVTNFDRVAFNFVHIGDPSSNYLWMPILTSLLSFFYGYYTFKLAPKPKLLPLKKTKPKKEGEQAPLFDPEAMQKSLEFQTMYIFPALTLFINLSLTAGVNIYFLTVSVISLVRQVFLTNYYARHTDQLVEQIIDSDPTSVDNDPTNNLEITASGDITGNQETPVLVEKTPKQSSKKSTSSKPQQIKQLKNTKNQKSKSSKSSKK